MCFRGGGKKSTFSVPFPRRNTLLEEGRLISQIFVVCKHSIVFVSFDGSAAEIMYETYMYNNVTSKLIWIEATVKKGLINLHICS